MAKFIQLLAITITILTIFSRVALGGAPRSRPKSPSPSPSPPPPPSNATLEYLTTHNKARSEVKVGPMKWNEHLANVASLQVRYQRDNKNCTFANLENSQYGANQFWSSGLKVTPRVAVESWMGEKKFYNYGDNSCAPGHRCGVYTQVVWRESVELGCAQGVCTKNNQSSLIICYYNPPGNYVGEKPY